MVASSIRLREQLDVAQAAWMAGDWRVAHRQSKGVLAQALQEREPGLQAGACLLLARVLSLQSQFALSAQFASRARALFSDLQDAPGVSEAMLAASYVESALGQGEAAAATAEQVSAGASGVQKRAAGGLTYRGIAALWRGEFGTARGVLDAACELSPEETAQGASAFQPLVNAIFAEVLRCAEVRMQGHRTDLAELESLLAKAWALARKGATGCLVGISALPGLFLLSFATCFFAARAGQGARADKYYLKCLEHMSRLPESSWMHALVLWARLERSIAAREVHEAAVSAGRMLVVAAGGEHQPMKALARRIGAEAQSYLAAARSPHATFM